ncbi:hypothetical protein H0H81_010748 [Sphagnurus paluster]|uniref:Uncharacterized protein n=1 Tax=Sphagnurus paluster TaxID=117069 RepID=A0A9P7KKR7_9AGAR|nr:hypothetical protein H0H81_010748 [Sphagnurus paluster]
MSGDMVVPKLPKAGGAFILGSLESLEVQFKQALRTSGLAFKTEMVSSRQSWMVGAELGGSVRLTDFFFLFPHLAERDSQAMDFTETPPCLGAMDSMSTPATLFTSLSLL